jgi:ketosteroid isomerase-like protein
MPRMDTTEHNRQLLRQVFAQMTTGNTRAMSDAMADDFRWTFPGDWSWSGSWGPKEVVLERLLRPLMAQFASYTSRAESIVAEGHRVVVQAAAEAVTKRGDRYDQRYCYVFRVRDGRLVECVEYCDSALVERVLERPSAPPPAD